VHRKVIRDAAAVMKRGISTLERKKVAMTTVSGGRKKRKKSISLIENQIRSILQKKKNGRRSIDLSPEREEEGEKILHGKKKKKDGLEGNNRARR